MSAVKSTQRRIGRRRCQNYRHGYPCTNVRLSRRTWGIWLCSQCADELTATPVARNKEVVAHA